ncbi:glycosyltransferase family A protein [uncultured Rhodoferax sp.]|uniref:glycosyltransferase family 2 protein n=1 Tax=uncultured Rhodoferax sp. TaxID=223188 RepID=UPI0025EFDA2A|nr:glycosyltransferase family A protein [uncultured Rhodoferax sp.]
MPKVAFWMPTFNEARFLARTIETVMAQTHPDVDLIISDNHSTDGSREIIAQYMARHPNIQLWSPPEHCAALDHFFFMWAKLKQLDYDFFIHTGGHDWVDPRYVEHLLRARSAHPDASIICGRGAALDKDDQVLGEYSGKTPGLQGPYTPYNPFSIILMTSSNVAIHGLMPAATVRRVDFRYKCPAVDVMFIAEVSTYGDVIYVPDALFYQRISGASTAGYLDKHMGVSDEDVAALVRIMNMQFQYLSEVADLACARLPAPCRGLYKSALMGAYYVKWCAPDQASGALVHIGPVVEKFLADMERSSKDVEQGLRAYFEKA